MWHKWIITYSILILKIAHADAQNVSVTLVPTQSRFSATEDVQVTLSYKNMGPSAVSIHRKYLPTENLFDPLFEVTRDGEGIEYVGPLCKRRLPTVQDLFILQLGEDVSTNILLSTVYDMSKSGTYTVQFKANAASMMPTLSHDLALDGFILQSTVISFYTEAHSDPLGKKRAESKAQMKLFKSGTFSYRNCSISQQNSIAETMQPVINYAAGCVQYLMSMNVAVTPRYTTWFGRYSLFNVLTVRKGFASIYAALTTQAISFDCTCKGDTLNTFAYVYRNIPYYINLCSMYWSSPITGRDSQVGTIIHELSHFETLAGTVDIIYGQVMCQKLAAAESYIAINNADSFEYFAENDPMLL